MVSKTMASKLLKLRKAIREPPAERLASIEYKSHFMNILGILIVTIILIAKGFWYIIFAFIFSIGVSYSQGVTAYRKYLLIKKLNPAYENVEDDPSPSRRRDRIIKETYGTKLTHFVTLLAMFIAWILIDPLEPGWRSKVAFTLLLIFIKIIIYYFPIYWGAYLVYNIKLKGGSQYGQQEKTRSGRRNRRRASRKTKTSS